MKTISFIFYIFIYQIALSNNENGIIFTIALEDSGQVKLKIINKTCQTIHISNPKYWGCSFPRISNQGKQVPTIRVRHNPQNLDKIIQIESNSEIQIDFDYSIQKILSQKGDGLTYSMFFEYYGRVNGEFLKKSLKSNSIEFVY